MTKPKPPGHVRRSTTGGPGKRNVDQTNWRVQLREHRIKFDDDAKKRFLDVFRECNLMMKSAEAAGVSLQTVRDHIENDPEFEQMFLEAKEFYKDKVLAHVQNLAFNGITNDVFAGKDGDKVGTKTEYPIQLVAMEAKKVDPSYKERSEVELNTGGGGVIIAPADKTPEQWIKEQEEKNKHRKKPGTDDNNAPANT
jgi:hypothetical protein